MDDVYVRNVDIIVNKNGEYRKNGVFIGYPR